MNEQQIKDELYARKSRNLRDADEIIDLHMKLLRKDRELDELANLASNWKKTHRERFDEVVTITDKYQALEKEL